jgi:hypothetical protein
LLHLQVHEGNGRQRLPVYALGSEAPVIDTRVEVGRAQGFVGETRPAFTHVDELLTMVRQLTLAALARIHVKTRLGAEPCRCDLAGGGEQMCVKVARVAPGTRCVHRQIHRDPIALRDLARETARQRDALERREFCRQVDLKFARDPRVVTFFSVLGSVPQALATVRPQRRRRAAKLLRQENLAMEHVPPAAVVLQFPAALIAQALPGTVGRGGRGPATGTAADGTDLQVEDRHRANLRAGS